MPRRSPPALVSLAVSAGALLSIAVRSSAWASDLGETPDAPGYGRRLLIGLAVNVLLAAGGWWARSIDFSGAVAGIALGTTLYACLDWRGYALLLAFFAIGAGCTRLGFREKAAVGLAQENQGRRGARHAVANAAVPVACALLAVSTSFAAPFTVACAAAFATAAADTAGSEIGQLWGRRPRLITTLRPVPRGTEGAVSVEGTLAGLAASLVVAAIGALVGLYGRPLIVWVVVAAFAGTTFESLLGALVGRRGRLGNEAMNFLNTLVGAGLGGILAWYWG